MLLIFTDPVIKTGYNNIFVIVDRFTKFSYFIPTNENTDIKQLAYIVLKVIINVYNLLNKIVSDKKATFASKFWQSLMAKLGLNLKLTTVFKP